ncbi:Bacterial membrane protein YfhO [compost metagenome]
MASFRPRIPATPAFAAIRRRVERILTVARSPLPWMAAVAFLFLATLVGTRPLAWSLGSGTLDPVDGVLNAWIMAWGAKALASDPASFFQAPFFYPAANALAFSENLLGNLPLFGPLLAVSGDPYWAANAFTVLSIFLTGLATFGLMVHWTRSRVAGLVAALFFALSPIRMSQTDHLHVFGIWWTPLAIWMASRFLSKGRWRDALLAAAFLVAQFASSLDLGYFLLVLLGAYLAIRVIQDREIWRRDLIVKGATATGLAGVALVPVILPYLRVGEAWGMNRTLRDAATHGADVLSFFTAWPGSLLFGSWVRALPPLNSHQMLFPGVAVLLGAGFALVWAWRNRGERLSREAFALAGAGAFAAILSLGPTLQVAGHQTFIPLPYAVFFYALPGFGAIRIPAQFALMVALALALLAGFGAYLLLKRWEAVPRQQVAIATLVLALALMDTATRPLTIYPEPRATDLDAFLARRAEGPMITLPMPTYENEADGKLESARMLAALTHGLPMVNGTSDLFPRSYLDLARRLERGPSPEALDALAAIGVKTLVLRLDQMPLGLREHWELDRDPSSLGLVPLWFEEGKSAIYHLTREPKPADLLYATLLVPERLPAGWDFTMGLALNVPGKTIWTAPMPPERQPLTIRWEGPAQKSQVTKSVWLPLTVQGPESIGIPLRAPARPGRYQVTVEGASLKATASVDVASWTASDSLTLPPNARVTWAKPQPSDVIVPGVVLPLRWEVVNEGENVWRARTTWRQRLAAHPEWLREHPQRLFEPGAGEVMLEVRWLKRRTGTDLVEGQSRVRRYPLRHDVFPGQRYVFDESLFVPEKPGGYIVELRLTDAFGTFSTPIERREIRVHELAGLRDFLKRFQGM